MSAAKRKGDAGEAAWQAKRESEGWRCFPLSPSFEGVDLISIGPQGHIELAEVKAWATELPPGLRADCMRRLLDVQGWIRELLPPAWASRVSVVLVHAVKGEDGVYRCAENWRFP